MYHVIINMLQVSVYIILIKLVIFHNDLISNGILTIDAIRLNLVEVIGYS